MANFARHSYGTDWIPKLSENMWRMKKEDIERRRNARGEMLKMKTGMGSELNPEESADWNEQYGEGSADIMNQKAGQISTDRKKAEAEKTQANTFALQDRVNKRQTDAFNRAMKIGEFISKMEGKDGMDAPTAQLFGKMQEALKASGTEVDFSTVVDQKEAAEKIRDASLTKFTKLYKAAEADPSDANISSATEAYRQAKIAKVPEIDVFNMEDLRKRQGEKKQEVAVEAKRVQTEKAAAVKRKQGMEDFTKKERFKKNFEFNRINAERAATGQPLLSYEEWADKKGPDALLQFLTGNKDPKGIF